MTDHSTPHLDLKIRLRAPYVAPLNILQCLCLKALRNYQDNGASPGKGEQGGGQLCASEQEWKGGGHCSHAEAAGLKARLLYCHYCLYILTPP